MPIITLTTDFGNSDPFVGIMKGVILNICPKVQIIDLTHNISPQNIEQANYILGASYRFFPKSTINVCIVDPGTGTSRKPVLIETKNYFFIGPDNGIFTIIIETENIKKVISLTKERFFLPEISQTFHGRDIFSPVAAHLAKILVETPYRGISTFGETINPKDLVKLKKLELIKKGEKYIGQVLHIDQFGNLITNIPNNLINKQVKGKFKNFIITGLVLNYEEANIKELTLIKGSSGYIELFIKKGNAAKLTNAKIGDKLEIKYSS